MSGVGLRLKEAGNEKRVPGAENESGGFYFLGPADEPGRATGAGDDVSAQVREVRAAIGAEEQVEPLGVGSRRRAGGGLQAAHLRLRASQAGGNGGLGQLRGLAQAAHLGTETRMRGSGLRGGLHAHRIPPEIEKNGPFW